MKAPSHMRGTKVPLTLTPPLELDVMAKNIRRHRIMVVHKIGNLGPSGLLGSIPSGAVLKIIESIKKARITQW